MPGWPRTLLAAGLGLAPGACEDGSGFLDPDVVHDLSRDEGTGEGFDLSGQYTTMADAIDCGCQGALGPGLSLCSTIPPGQTTPVGVVQSDGYIAFRVGTDTFTGPVEDDGAFSAGALVDVTSGTTGVRLVSRMDGTFEETDYMQFEADLWWHAEGEAPTTTGEPTRIDCIEHLLVTGIRY